MRKDYYPTDDWDCRRSVGYLARRASNLMLGRLEAVFAEHDLTFMQWVVLMSLRNGIAHTAADICKDLGHDSGALTRLIDQLEKRHLLERHRSTEDRRVVTLHLTGEGRRTAQSLIPLVADYYNVTLTGFTREETDTLIRLLTKLVDQAAAPSGASNHSASPHKETAS